MIWLKRFLIVALIALVVIQFFRPEQNNGGYESLKPFLAETGPDLKVQAILKTSCYDCHSNQTDYPWYAYVAPTSFYLRSHITSGKHHLNFSAWNAYAAKQKDHKLKELQEQVKKGDMPLTSYTLIHRDAALSAEQAQAVIDWAQTARLKYSVKASRSQ